MAGPHDKVPGRRGRPPGSKNKRTLAMESLAQQGLTPGQQQAAMALLKQRAEQKRVEDEENLQAAVASGQKRRGRPPGSRNRPREEGRPGTVTSRWHMSMHAAKASPSLCTHVCSDPNVVISESMELEMDMELSMLFGN